MKASLKEIVEKYDCRMGIRQYLGGICLVNYQWKDEKGEPQLALQITDIPLWLSFTFAALRDEWGVQPCGVHHSGGAKAPVSQDLVCPAATPKGRRWDTLVPNGVPRWVRCYDNGGGAEWSCRKCHRFYADSADHLLEQREQNATKLRCECGGLLHHIGDQQGSGDRYTVCFTGKAGSYHYPGHGTEYSYRAMCAHPYHPQGIGMWGSTKTQPCDTIPAGNKQGHVWPPALYRHGRIGKRIAFKDLPEDCRRCVFEDYIEIWRLWHQR